MKISAKRLREISAILDAVAELEGWDGEPKRSVIEGNDYGWLTNEDGHLVPSKELLMIVRKKLDKIREKV